MMLRASWCGHGVGRITGSDLLFHDKRQGPKLNPLTLILQNLGQESRKVKTNRVGANCKISNGWNRKKRVCSVSAGAASVHVVRDGRKAIIQSNSPS
jgi:hypothetical protein